MSTNSTEMVFSKKSLDYNSYDKLISISNINQKQVDDYVLLGYKKSELTNDVKKYRSLVFHKKKLLAYCPPKSLDYDHFKNLYDRFRKLYTDESTIDIEMFVEGTMIMVYYNQELETWHTSTRGNIGANCSFFESKTKKTFRNMFDETCNVSFLDINSLNKELCYIFVMNHPDNRIVSNCKIPELYLVKVYKIVNNEDKTFDVFVLNNLDVFKEEFTNTLVKFPNTYLNTETIRNKIDFVNSNNTINYDAIVNEVNTYDFNIMGLVIFDKVKDVRIKLRNKNYEYVRSLRGNQPKLDYRYLELKKNKNINKYLVYYPEHKEDFEEYWNKTKDFTNDLYNYYVSTHISKDKMMNNIPKEFKPHLYNLHQYYLNELRPNKYSIQRPHVINYVNLLPEAMLLFALNYNKHKIELKLQIPIVNDLTPENKYYNENMPMAPRTTSQSSVACSF